MHIESKFKKASSVAASGRIVTQANQQVTLVSIDQLIPYKGNARTHSKKQIEQIAASIRKFGFNNPHLSYVQKLSNEHSDACRRLVSSDWYQARWGEQCQLDRDQIELFSNFAAVTGAPRRSRVSPASGPTSLWWMMPIT
jgi:hypothetical protein